MTNGTKKYTPLTSTLVSILGLIFLAVFKLPFLEPLNTIMIISFVILVAFTVYGVIKVPHTKAFFGMSAIVAIYLVIASLIIGIIRFGSLTFASPELIDAVIYTVFYAAPVIALCAAIVTGQHLRGTR